MSVTCMLTMRLLVNVELFNIIFCLYGYLKKMHETFAHSSMSPEGVNNKYEQKAA